jgi:hypothetical protein
MKQENKLSSGQRHEHAAESQSTTGGGLEFQSVEELLRYDAGKTVVPPEVARRLSQSIAESGLPRRPWWRRLFSR